MASPSVDLPALQRLAGALGVPLHDEALGRFAIYRAHLLDWNRRVNLTAVTDPAEVEVKLFADSLALFPYLERQRVAQAQAPLRLIDVGSGAGFPGLALKLAEPTLDVVLLEATGKKVTFLNAVIGALGLGGIQAIHGRAEELAHQPNFRASFDIVTARGVARLPALLEFCLPFLRAGGHGLFPKGQSARAEADEAASALATLGARLVAIDPVPLPELAGTSIIEIEQRAAAPRRYPRRAGLPLKRPL